MSQNSVSAGTSNSEDATSSSFDVVVIGSGAGGLATALKAAVSGLSVVVLEKQDVVGGSTALSGGMAWLPVNVLLSNSGLDATPERALTYLHSVVGDVGPAASDERTEAFIDAGRDVIDLLLAEGVGLRYPRGYVEYYPENPGGEPAGRSVEPTVFDARELGDWEALLPPNRLPLLVHGSEAPKLVLAKRSLSGLFFLSRVLARTTWARLRRAPMRTAGSSLIGQLLHSVKARNVPVWMGTSFVDFLTNNEDVIGVVVSQSGVRREVRASLGVVLAAGGFSRNDQLRAEWQPEVGHSNWTSANPGDTGEVLDAARKLGADLALLDEAWWIPTAIKPDGTRTMILTERSLPHSIVVDSVGNRFCNEATNYMAVGKAMIEHNRLVSSIPSWLIMDSRHRHSYPFGAIPPGVTPSNWLTSGFMVKARTLEELAERCSINAEGLERTVAHFNEMARDGVDSDFGRGASAHNRNYGDRSVRPNPNMGSIEKSPFYAVAIYPGDVGTCGGLLTDRRARVLRGGKPIPGLYATGNTTATVMGRVYPGAGASIGYALAFGYIAADEIKKSRDASGPAAQ